MGAEYFSFLLDQEQLSPSSRIGDISEWHMKQVDGPFSHSQG
jgi:hypothetical protein